MNNLNIISLMRCILIFGLSYLFCVTITFKGFFFDTGINIKVKEHLYISEKNKLHVLKMVPYLHSKKLMNRSPHITYNQREVRMQEIIDSIQYTIEHPLVGSLYIFYQNISLISYIEKHNLTRSPGGLYAELLEMRRTLNLFFEHFLFLFFLHIHIWYILMNYILDFI